MRTYNQALPFAGSPANDGGMRWAHYIHQFLKWVFPAVGAGGIAICGLVVAAAGIWDPVKLWVESAYVRWAALWASPIAAFIIFLLFAIGLMAFIWSGHLSQESAEKRPRFTSTDDVLEAAQTDLRSVNGRVDYVRDALASGSAEKISTWRIKVGMQALAPLEIQTCASGGLSAPQRIAFRDANAALRELERCVAEIREGRGYTSDAHAAELYRHRVEKLLVALRSLIVSLGGSPAPLEKEVGPVEAPTDLIPLEDAGRWLYANASGALKEVLKGGVPSPFNTIADHAAAYYTTQWQEGRCDLYGRLEPGLPMEKIDPKDGDFSAFSAVFGSEKRPLLDQSVMRRDLKPVLDYYEEAVAGVAEPKEPIKVRRDTPLREALMFLVTGSWGLDPWSDGDGSLSGLGDALVEFRQLARDGTFSVWGLESRHGVWGPVAKEYWADHRVDSLDVLREDRETPTKADNLRSNAPLYVDLMVCRAEFEHERR